jgi:lauroyl/myristoyl acyltransferase
MLGVLIDQHAGDKGVWTPFFGRLASTTPFPAVLAKKTGAALMPVSIVTSGIARWRVEVDDFIPSRGINCRNHGSYQSESGKADSKESERLILGS